MRIRVTSSFSLGHGRHAGVGDVLSTPHDIPEVSAETVIARRWAVILPDAVADRVIPHTPVIQTRDPQPIDRDAAIVATSHRSPKFPPAARRRKVRKP